MQEKRNELTKSSGSGPIVFSRLSLYIAAFGLIAALVIMLDSAPYENIEYDFTTGNSNRSGALIMPTNTPSPRGLMIFVHGDGAMGRSAFGYYYPLWQRLAKAGIASYSWDKAGVGGSEGNWLEQNMQIRATEVLDLVSSLRQQPQFKNIPIGLIGFSQGGWVMPKALKASSELSFAVFVSTPINWLKQSEFLTRTRLEREGITGDLKVEKIQQTKEVSKMIANGAQYEAYLNYLKRADPDSLESVMSMPRYGFVQKNISEDSELELRAIQQPLFVAFGKHDTHINVASNIAHFERIFTQSPEQLTLKIYQNANHTLLKNSEFGHLLPSVWWLIKVSLWEEDGFSEQFLDDVMSWLNVQITELSANVH
jgi:alpha-beta hydrolase superfamily lysophospholipase